jgi:hypothetical protein
VHVALECAEGVLERLHGFLVLIVILEEHSVSEPVLYGVHTALAH